MFAILSMNAADALLQERGAVSYTHLDVYKRQVAVPFVPLQLPLPPTEAGSDSCFFLVSKSLTYFQPRPPVSYTHLDVYKRQV